MSEEWRCAYCGHLNARRRLECSTCRAPRPAQESPRPKPVYPLLDWSGSLSLSESVSPSDEPWYSFSPSAEATASEEPQPTPSAEPEEEEWPTWIDKVLRKLHLD